MVATLTPRKSPRQARSQAMVATILDATARVLIEGGYAAVNTNAVAERAGVSVGSLYQYFPNKNALVAALHERHRQQMVEVSERVLVNTASKGLEDAMSEMMEAMAEAHRVDADLHRVLEMQCPALGGSPSMETEALIADRMRAMLVRHRDEIQVENLDLAVYTLMHSTHALVHMAVQKRPKGVTLKQATREMVRLVRGYLMTPMPAA